MELSAFLKNNLRRQSLVKLEKRALELAKIFDNDSDPTDEATEAALDAWQMHRALAIQLCAENQALEDEDHFFFPYVYIPEDYAA